MHRMAAGLPLGWQVDLEDLGNEHGKSKIQPCNACVSSSMALCVWPCNCYGRIAIINRTFFGTRTSTGGSRADARAFIGPINWYGPTTNFKLLFDRLVCMNGGNPRPDLIEKKNALLAQALERSSQWRELSKNHLEGRSAAFFCYRDRGGADLDATGRPKILVHKEWFDPKAEPYDNERDATKAWCGNVVIAALRFRTRCGAMRRSGSENYTRARKLTALKARPQHSRRLMSGRTALRSTWEAKESWKARTMPHAARSPRRNDYEYTTGLPSQRHGRTASNTLSTEPPFGIRVFRFTGGNDYGSVFQIRVQGRQTRHEAPQDRRAQKREKRQDRQV